MNKAKSLVLSCIDFRFQKMIEDFLEIDADSFKSYDRVSVAGSVKQLVKPEKQEYKDFLLEQLQISVSLHHPDSIYLINHEDCGAYGVENNLAIHEKDLRDAYNIVTAAFPATAVKLYIATFNGLKEVLPV